jgi:hypothetical protein
MNNPGWKSTFKRTPASAEVTSGTGVRQVISSCSCDERELTQVAIPPQKVYYMVIMRKALTHNALRVIQASFCPHNSPMYLIDLAGYSNNGG